MKIDDVLLSPRIAIERAISDLNNTLNGDTVVNDNSPFFNLLEVSRALAVDSLVSSNNIIRKKFPILANNMEDLFFNIHDEVKDNLFAIGGTVPILMYINVLDLKQYGVKEGNSYISVIPTGSTISVLNTTFTILNDIKITLRDNDLVTVEQEISDLDIAINDLYLLPTDIITDDNGIEWILFETRVRNITKNTSILPITHEDTIEHTITLNNKYSTIAVYYTDNNRLYPLSVSYSDTYLDETTPTALVALKDNQVDITIPKIYITNNMVKNKIIIDVFETEGEKTLDLSKLTTEDFTLNIENEGNNKYTATIININKAVSSRGVLSNGVNAMSFQELKQAIIESTLGDIDLPITTNQLTRKSKMYGYDLRVSQDTLLGREFIASKPLPITESNLIQSYPDIYFNIAEILLSDEVSNRNIELYERIFILKENTVFKKDKNGLVKLLSDSEQDYFNSLSKKSKIEYCILNKLYFTPFTYVVKYEKDITTSEVYYLKPEIKSMRILNTNTLLKEKINTGKYGLFKTNNGYSFKLLPILNDDISSTDLTTLKARLFIPIYNSNSSLYFDSKYNQDTGLFTFDILTGELYENKIEIVNGTTLLKDVRCNIETRFTVYIYSEDENLTDTSNFLRNEIGIADNNVTIFTKETFNISLGKNLKYLYNNVLTMLTGNYYQRHIADVPYVYEKNVYKIHENGLYIDPNVLSDGRIDLGLVIKHEKGKTAVDERGNIVYKHRTNDIVRDSNGNPIINKYSGIKRLMEIIMLDYEYLVSDSELYVNYLDMCRNKILSMLEHDLVELNDITMDVTKIRYKTFRTNKDCFILVNNIAYPIPSNITPIVTLVLDKNNVISSDTVLDNIRSNIGKIISKHVNKETIVIEDIRKDIMSKLTYDVRGVKITNLEPKNSEIINLTKDNTFTINKRLDLTDTQQLIVKYDLKIEIEYI